MPKKKSSQDQLAAFCFSLPDLEEEARMVSGAQDVATRS